MAMNISCKFEKASYNTFFVRAVTVKSLYTMRRRRRRRQRRRNEVKSIVSTGCYPVDTKMARHIVCVLDRTVGHVSICWDYVSTFLCNKN